MKVLSLGFLSLVIFVQFASAQKTEISITFGEQFFEALLDAVFQHSAPPQFALSSSERHDGFGSPAPTDSPGTGIGSALAAQDVCDQSITLLREGDGVRTAVRFREGQISAPLAFKGNYNPPLIGCVPFSGVADTVIDLEFDRSGQRLVARARVTNVALSGTGGVGGSVIAKLVQGSLDKRINPIEIVRTDKVSFVVPMQNANSVKMRATGFTHEIVNGQLTIRVTYEFLKN